MEQAEDVVLREAVAALQEVQLDGEGQSGDFAAQLLHELDGGFHRAAGSQQVIDQHYALSGLNGVQVNLQRVGAVLQIIGHARDGRGQFVRLAHGHKAGVEPVGQGGAKDKAAGLDAEDEVDLAREIVRRQRVNQLRKKIEDDPANPVYLLTDVYVGYRFADAQSFIGEDAEEAAEEIAPEEAS